MDKITKARLISKIDAANIRLYQEIALVKSSLDIYKIVAINASEIEYLPGSQFFAMSQMQSLTIAILGFAKIFEQNERYPLCSINGIVRLLLETSDDKKKK